MFLGARENDIEDTLLRWQCISDEVLLTKLGVIV